MLYNGIYTLARYSHYLPTFTLGGFLAFSACQGAHRIDNDGLTFINSVTDTVIEKKTVFIFKHNNIYIHSSHINVYKMYIFGGNINISLFF